MTLNLWKSATTSPLARGATVVRRPRAWLALAVIGLLVIAGSLQEGLPPVSANHDLPDGFEHTTVATGLIEPTHMAFSLDGSRLIVSEISGRLLVYDVAADTLATFLDLPGTEPYGVVFDPRDNGYFYVFYNSPSTGNEFRVSRWTVGADPNVADSTTELVILEVTGLGTPTHSGGDLQFGPDGMLYVTVGDGASHDDFVRTEPQSFDSLMGKILRIDPSMCDAGSCGDIIPPDNPDFTGVEGYDPATARGEIYARGLRNPYNSDFDPVTGTYQIIDVGTNASTVPAPEDRFEEANLGIAGANYGWNVCHGVCNDPPNNVPGSIDLSLLVDPVYSYDHTGPGKAIIGAAFYRDTQFPADFYGDFLIADFSGGYIDRLKPDFTVVPFVTGLPKFQIVDLRVGPDGSLYVLMHGGTVDRIEFVGPTIVKDIRGGQAGSDPQWLTEASGTLFFTADLPRGGRELWKSDGTAAGTALVRNLAGSASSTPQWLTDVGGTVFFSADLPRSGRELWKSDGTAAGTRLVRNILGGSDGSDPQWLTDVGGTLFFTADLPKSGRELWKSDGTAVGTEFVRNLAGSASSDPQWLTDVGGTLFFTADVPSSGRELWKTDGTAAGTTQVIDIRGGSSGSDPQWLTDIGGTLFFTADLPSPGRELWKSDGTAVGTVFVRNLAGSASSDPQWLTDVGGTVFFTADLPSSGRELWKSDGTGVGTVLVRNIAGGALGSDPQSLTNVSGTLYFSAHRNSRGRELWRSDGTAAGTVLHKDLIMGASGSDPQWFTDLSGTLFFNADVPGTGRELWKN